MVSVGADFPTSQGRAGDGRGYPPPPKAFNDEQLAAIIESILRPDFVEQLLFDELLNQLAHHQLLDDATGELCRGLKAVADAEQRLAHRVDSRVGEWRFRSIAARW